MANVVDFLLSWPLYVNDNGVVTCYHQDCGDDNAIEVPRRRVDVAEFLQGVGDHIRKHHGLEVPDGR